MSTLEYATAINQCLTREALVRVLKDAFHNCTREDFKQLNEYAKTNNSRFY